MGRSWRSAEIAAFIAAVSVRLKPQARSILDLGAGFGDLAPLLMDAYRGASYHGIDHDPTRLGLVEGKLAFYEGNVSLDGADLLAAPFGAGHDLAVSAAALRHFNPSDKRRIFTRVHQALAPEGLFIFGDRVRLASPRIAQAVREMRAAEMHAIVAAGPAGPPAEKRTPDAADRESIADTLFALRRAAFLEVDCLYCYGDRAVFAGFK